MVVLTWGWNQNAQLGHGDAEPRVVPQIITSLEGSTIVQTACGSRYSVALSERGNVFTWGRGDDYQLGLSKGTSLAQVPRLVQSLEKVVVIAVAARHAHTLALSATGQVWAWGCNDEGQLGVGTREPCKVPKLVNALEEQGVVIKKIACGRDHSAAVASDGKLYTWGSNDDGATGQGFQGRLLQPELVDQIEGATAVACGSRHTLVLVEGPGIWPKTGLVNKLLAFGWGGYGQLGNNARVSQADPVEVQFPSNVKPVGMVARITDISCGFRHSLAIVNLTKDAASPSRDDLYDPDPEMKVLWAWGWNHYGQLGYETSSKVATIPGQVIDLDGSVQGVTGGGRHTLAIVKRASDGATRTYAFGRNDDGQLGLGFAFSSQTKPERVRCFGADVIQVSAGWSHSICALEDANSEDPGTESGKQEAEFGAALSKSPSTQWLADRQRMFTPVAENTTSWTERVSRSVKARLVSLGTAGNMDAGFGQFLNTLILLLSMLSSLRVRIGIDQSVVISRVVPGATLTVFMSNLVFGAWAEIQARQEAKTNSGTTFTALPHGISTVLFFAFIMLIMVPVFQKTGDAELAYRTGLACCFTLGVLELPCLFFVDRIRKVVPRAAMMSAMAGVSLTFIAMTFTVQIFSNPAVAIVPLTVILVCYGSNVQLPYKIPAGALALVLGTVIVFGAELLNIELMDPASENSSKASVEAISSAGGDSVFLPSSAVPDVLSALLDQRTWPYITVVLPLLIVNVVTNLSCLEGAAAVGDDYSTRWGLALDACMTILGALCGNPFPTCIYIGHGAFKSMGATSDYSYISAVSVLALGIFNGTSSVMKVVPEVAAVGVLMWIGLVVTAQAFDRDDSYALEASGSKSHAAAVALGLLPALAAWCLQYIQAVIPACGTVLSQAGGAAPVHVPFDEVMVQLESSGVFVYGLMSLSRGYLLSSIFLSSTLVEIIDRQFATAATWMFFASALSFIGAVHSFELDSNGISSSYGFPSRTIGDFPIKYSFAYASAGILLLMFELRESETSLTSAISRYAVRSWRKALGRKSLKAPKGAQPIRVNRALSLLSHESREIDEESALLLASPEVTYSTTTPPLTPPPSIQ